MKSDKKRAVVDTNVLVSGLLFPRGYPYTLLKLGITKKFELITSKELFTELSDTISIPRMMSRYDLDRESIDNQLRVIQAASTFVTPALTKNVFVRDPKDVIVIATAESGKADYLISGDKDLLVVKNNTKLGKLGIVTAREFISKEFSAFL